jgi:hypothetical protein
MVKHRVAQGALSRVDTASSKTKVRPVKKRKYVHLTTLTGIGRDFLSFRARARSAECPTAVDATYSMRSSLSRHQRAVGVGMFKENIQEGAQCDGLA